MTPTEDPWPREAGPYPVYAWPVERCVAFEPWQPAAEALFVDIFERRRSTRELVPAPVALLISMAQFALSPRLWKGGDPLKRSRRPALSAGALHPINVVLFSEDDVSRLNMDTCMLETLLFPAEIRGEWISKCRQLLPGAQGAFMVLIADMARPMSAYANCESLVWRDAGAMLQTLALAAEAYGLGFCPLGILGNEVVAALPSGKQLLAVGAAAVGWPVSQ